LMKNSVLERLWVVDYMTEIWVSNFKISVGKLNSEVEICWKSRRSVTTISWIIWKC
jgi:hypothetical protein